MKILASVCSFNDQKSLSRCLEGLRAQTHPLPEILVVDNRSSDGTPGEALPSPATLICHLRNLGPAGAADTAFRYGLDRGYEWLWGFDQDSFPEAGALEKLVQLYRSLPENLQRETGALCSTIVRGPEREPALYGRLTPRGPRPASVDPDREYYECDSAIWAGTLFRLDAVRRIGGPRYGEEGYWHDFSIDWGDVDFFLRLRRAGYRVLAHRGSLVDHALGGGYRRRSFLGRSVTTTDHPPFRRYLYFRNMTFFWLYLYPGAHRPSVAGHVATRSLIAMAKIVLMERDRIAKIRAILRGVWDGTRKNLRGRYRAPLP